MARIAPYLFADRKMAMAQEVTYGVNEFTRQGGATLAAHQLRVIECNSVPVAGAVARYSMPRRINVAVPQSRQILLHRKVTATLPFYVPSGASNMAAVQAYHEKILCAAGFQVATSGDDKVFTPAASNSANKSCTVVDERKTDRWTIRGARGNVKINFATDGENPCTYALDWLGLCTDTAPESVSSQSTPPMLDYVAADIGALPIFAEAQHLIFPLGGSATDWLACKAYEYDSGTAARLINDCNGASGVGGVHVVRDPGNQKVSFDVEAPETHALWPYVTRWAEGTVLVSQISLIGGADESFYYGVKIENCFQITDEPDVSDDGGIGRIKIGGVCCSPLAAEAALQPSMRITVGTIAAV